jgi:hypothetical protein
VNEQPESAEASALSPPDVGETFGAENSMPETFEPEASAAPSSAAPGASAPDASLNEASAPPDASLEEPKSPAEQVRDFGARIGREFQQRFDDMKEDGRPPWHHLIPEPGPEEPWTRQGPAPWGPPSWDSSPAAGGQTRPINASRLARLPPPIQGNGIDGQPWFLIPMGEDSPILSILETWSKQSLVVRDTNDAVEMDLHAEAVNDIENVKKFSQKLTLGRRCYFTLCRNKMEADPATTALIVGFELYEFNNQTLIKPCCAAFKPVVHRIVEESTTVATTMMNSWLGVILRTLNAKLDTSSFEAHGSRTNWLQTQMDQEAGTHGYADIGEKTNWSLQPHRPADPRIKGVLDEWAMISSVYQSDSCDITEVETCEDSEALKATHREEMGDIQRVRLYPEKQVGGTRLYFSLSRRDAELDAQSCSAVVCVEQVDAMMNLTFLVHSVAFKPALLNDKPALHDSTHLLVKSLFSLLSTIGATLDLRPLETSEQLAEVRESMKCGAAVQHALGFAKPQRWIAPPTVAMEDGWHLVPRCDGDSIVDTTLKEWSEESRKMAGSGDEHSAMHADALATLEKVQAFSTSERVYYFLCKDSEVPTSESVYLVLTADMDDATTFTIHMHNIVFKPSLLDDPQENIDASTKLVACLCDLMTKSGVILDMSKFETHDVCSRVVHDKLQHFTQ